MATRHRLPHGYHRRPAARPNEAAHRGMLEAMKALYDTETSGMTSAQMLAEDERLAREADDAQRRQGVLFLRGGR